MIHHHMLAISILAILNDVSSASTTSITHILANNISAGIPNQHNDKAFDLIKTLIAIACVIVISMCVIGNTLVVSVILRYNRLKNATNYILLSLAIADLTVSFLVMLPAMIQDVLQKWIFNNTFCWVWNAADISCCTASILHLLLVAIDRYIAIFKPLTYRNMLKTWHVFSAVVFVWTISVCMSFIPIYLGWNKLPKANVSQIKINSDNYTLLSSNLNDISYENSGSSREADLVEPVDAEICFIEANIPYAIISSSLSFWLPLIAMTIVYLQIYIVARRQAKAMDRINIGSRQMAQESSSVMFNSAINNKVNSANDINIRQHQQLCTFNEEFKQNNSSNSNAGPDDKKNRFLKLIKQLKVIEKKRTKDTKAIKTLGIIMGIFIICWLPFFIMYLYVSLSNKTFPLIAERLITWIGYINSFINPIVYALTNKDFRKAYVSTLKDLSKKVFPKSFYYYTFGRNDTESIYYNSLKRKRNKNYNNKTTSTNTSNSTSKTNSKCLNFFKCFCIKSSNKNHASKREKNSLAKTENEDINVNNSFKGDNNNKAKNANTSSNSNTANNDEDEDKKLASPSANADNNITPLIVTKSRSIKQIDSTSNKTSSNQSNSNTDTNFFKLLSDDKNSIVYIDNDNCTTNSNNSNSEFHLCQPNDCLNRSETISLLNAVTNLPGAIALAEEFVDEHERSYLASVNNTSNNDDVLNITNDDYFNDKNISFNSHSNKSVKKSTNLLKKFRKSFVVMHSMKSDKPLKPIDINHELELLNIDLAEIKDADLDDNSLNTSANALTDATSSKKDSIYSDNKTTIKHKLSSTSAKSRIKRMLTIKKKESLTHMNNNNNKNVSINNTNNHCGKNEQNTKEITNLTVFRL